VYSGTLALKGATAGARVRGQMVEEGRRTVKERERDPSRRMLGKNKKQREKLCETAGEESHSL